MCNDNENNRNVVLIVGDQKHGWLSSDEKVSSVTMFDSSLPSTHIRIYMDVAGPRNKESGTVAVA